MIRAIVAEGTTPAETVAIALIVAAKFALPLLIVPFPFVAGWANFFLDAFDGDWLIRWACRTRSTSPSTRSPTG